VNKMPYQTLNEPRTGSQTVGSDILSKFCSLGFVTSYTWNATFVHISEGFVRLYDKEETFQHTPENFVQEIYLDDDFASSDIKLKDYSRVEGKVVPIYYIYIEVKQGFWAPYRVIKLGAFEREKVEKVKSAIDGFRKST